MVFDFSQLTVLITVKQCPLRFLPTLPWHAENNPLMLLKSKMTVWDQSPSILLLLIKITSGL